MALALGLDQRSVHECSRAVLQRQLSRYARVIPQWEPPRFKAAVSEGEKPVIPSASVFESRGSDPRKTPQRGGPDGNQLLPSAAECATHLQLLEAFQVLKEKVMKSNALDCAFKLKRNLGHTKKWDIYVALAVARFGVWWEEKDSGAHIDMEKSMPPIDVLLVWHSLLLSPTTYQAFCEATGRVILLAFKFPWKAIHKAISLKDSSYTQPSAAATAFTQTTGFHCELLAYLANFTQFFPLVTKLLHKWADGAIQRADINQVLESATDMTPDQVSFVQSFLALLNTQAIERRSAVMRQGTFVEKVGKQAWLRSPALHGTISRAIDRYVKFLALFQKYPNTLFVPTLDIDLVWHTLLCSPQDYRSVTSSLAGRFVGHDDAIAQETLRSGLETTKNLFRVRFGEEYLRCLCWDCEALRQALEKVREQSGQDVDYEAISQTVSLDVAYYRAVEIARRQGKALPARPRN